MFSRPLAAAVLGLWGLGTLVACGASPEDRSDTEDLDAVVRTATPTAHTPPSADPAGPDGTARSSPRAKPLAGKVVVIDPGHNGGNWRHPREINRQVDVLTKRKACDTTGTSTNDGYSEAAFTWDVSKRLAKRLRSMGAVVKLSRTDNTSWGPCITERAAIGNRAGADAAISIHADGAPPTARGFHIIVPKKINGPVDPVVGESRRLGRTIRDAFRRGTGLPYSNYLGENALVARSDLGGLNLSKVPKIFLECGNMRNAQDAAKFKDERFRQRIADSLARGLRDYLLR